MIKARHIGAEAIQIFPSNPRQWRTHSYTDDELFRFSMELKRRSLPLFIHSTYLMNLASPDADLRRRSAGALAEAFRFACLTGAAGVVTHVGSHRGEGLARAVPRIVASVIEARHRAERLLGPDGPPPSRRAGGETSHQPDPRLLLETSAGGGNTVGSTPSELGILVEQLGGGTEVCLDTAHLFAAGYAINTEDGLENLLDELSAAGLTGRVALIHFNDSMTGLGSKHDRHANLWEGLLGRAGLSVVMGHPTFRHVPFVLEVPGFDGHGPDGRNVRRARLMRRVLSRPAPAGAGRPTPSRATCE